MTETYPLLTVANVYHWYWECDPAWSGWDIAKAIGCKHPATVYQYIFSIFFKISRVVIFPSNSLAVLYFFQKYINLSSVILIYSFF